MKGFLCAATSVLYVFKPGLKRYVILPIVFNFLIFFTLAYFLFQFIFPYSSYYINQLPSWLGFLQGILLVMMGIGFFLLFLSMFTILFNIIAAPFNGLLAEKAQKLLCNTPIPSISFATMLKRSIKRQMQFLSYFIPRFVAILLLFFVPFIHPFYPFMWFLFNAWMLSIQFQDFAMDNNLVSFKEMRNRINQSPMLSLGFGSFISLASFVPILNLIVMPAAVIGGTRLFCKVDERGTGQRPGE